MKPHKLSRKWKMTSCEGELIRELGTAIREIKQGD